MKKGEDESKFQELLDEQYTWPAKYTFKFIVPADKETEVKLLFDEQADIGLKESSKGKYSSVTIQAIMQDSDSIVKIYNKASEIEGIISL